MLSSHRRAELSVGLLPSRLPTKTLYSPLSIRLRATCRAYRNCLDLSTLLVYHFMRRVYVVLNYTVLSILLKVHISLWEISFF